MFHSCFSFISLFTNIHDQTRLCLELFFLCKNRPQVSFWHFLLSRILHFIKNLIVFQNADMVCVCYVQPPKELLMNFELEKLSDEKRLLSDAITIIGKIISSINQLEKKWIRFENLTRKIIKKNSKF